MPFYEYRCDACGHEFEAMQKISDAPLTDCPSCTAAELVKKVSAAGFRLKGGGWYETDFKKGAKKNVGDKPDVGAGEKKPDAKKSEGQGTSAGASSA
jgi:putative FmdB family regulatory protein